MAEMVGTILIILGALFTVVVAILRLGRANRSLA